ncbi:MAG: helix-turn-helix domain-containing protein [Actinomycetes bacterium]|jgi:DNA-binding IclR family transcriptional regulator
MAAETSQTLDRGLSVLELLASAPDGLTVTDIAGELGVSRTVVYRLVVTLEKHALVRRSSDGRCRLGLAVLSLARQVQPSIRDAALPTLQRLVDSAGATAHLTVVDGPDALVIAVVEPSRPGPHVALRPGMRHPVDRGAAGLAILSARDADPGPTGPALVMSVDVLPGTHGVAVAVVGVPGVEASVGLIALAPLAIDEVGPKLIRAAADIARVLR